jgi:hypothetical protein
MDKKLYRVRVVLYVMAENESEARLAATQARFDIFECTAKKVERIEPDWENAIPYNSDDYRSCAEVLAGQPPVVHPAALFPAGAIRQQPQVRTSFTINAVQESAG